MLKPTTLAMILAGSRVNELNVLTSFRPKSAVPFGGLGRVIDFPLSNLLNSGIEQVALLSQYRSYSLINHIGTGAAWDMIGRYRRVSILPPSQGSEGGDWYRGPADAIHQNIDFIRNHCPEEVLILSGDHVYNMDYQDLIDYHWEKDADLTIAFTRVPQSDAHRFGLAEIEESDDSRGGRILNYWEKPSVPQSNWASMTIMCFKPEVLYKALEENHQGDSYHFGLDIFPSLLRQKLKVYGYKYNGYWGYTRTIDEYWQSSMDMLGPEPAIDLEKWQFRTNLDHRNIRDNEPALMGEHAVVQNSLVYNGCKIDGTVKNSILFPGVHIKKGAIVENSILFYNNMVGEGCHLNKVVSDVNNLFQDNVKAGPEACEPNSQVTVIGWNNTILENTQIDEGVTIHPGHQSQRPDDSLAFGGEL
ncbi:glucose-1-phosphate adenylyltransferase family protein [Desulforhopalus sp. IMCC35007]|uniref:glucose-1-phosphate adenylyltransferase family protein n=1 Tax=Desulforhopalus sp. IMCC35007 TaxID=2569543 RepID=UPI0010ADFC5D|nr:glucose-1-phosphate adenylyltransferase family protein [Desulforhopalus sp. IMCC35007]TKB08816.1 glucose-1-phosphate adenylyltransferase [Desulforhopalus sp. IMCC35007]